MERAAAVVLAYEELAGMERQLDKAFKREFGASEEVLDDAVRVYRDRTRGLTGAAVVPAVEVLGRVPEGGSAG
eukprot:150466-Chlamydomonas_euryale.AAC.1